MRMELFSFFFDFLPKLKKIIITVIRMEIDKYGYVFYSFKNWIIF